MVNNGINPGHLQPDFICRMMCMSQVRRKYKH